MPFFKADDKFVYYTHVPKCGGSAIAYYLQDRFGQLGLYDNTFHKKRVARTAWTQTSPQHIDAETLETIVPLAFFDALFAVVRHPVPRTISTFHFQREVESRIPETMAFSDWLVSLEQEGFTRFAYDNHVLPMARLVPEGATIFHLEHGLDPLVAWLDRLTGRRDGPRVILPENARGMLVKVQSAKVDPTPEDIARIGRIYAEDFKRFGYAPDRKDPLAEPPELTEDFLRARDRDLQALQRPTARLVRRLRRRLQRL